MLPKKLLFTGFACLSLVGISSASPIVTNGDFETGDFTAWTFWNGTGAVTTPGISGDYQATLQHGSAIASDPLSTIVGQTYRFSVDVSSTAPAEFFMSLISISAGLYHDYHWNDSPDYTGDFNSGGSQTYSFEYVAQADDILYLGFNSLDGSDGVFDNVSVQAVPEPVSMLVLGAGSLALLRRRKLA